MRRTAGRADPLLLEDRVETNPDSSHPPNMTQLHLSGSAGQQGEKTVEFSEMLQNR